MGENAFPSCLCGVYPSTFRISSPLFCRLISRNSFIFILLKAKSLSQCQRSNKKAGEGNQQLRTQEKIVSESSGGVAVVTSLKYCSKAPQCCRHVRDEFSPGGGQKRPQAGGDKGESCNTAIVRTE